MSGSAILDHLTLQGCACSMRRHETVVSRQHEVKHLVCHLLAIADRAACYANNVASGLGTVRDVSVVASKSPCEVQPT